MTIPTPLQQTLENFETDLAFQSDEDSRKGASCGSSSVQMLSEFLPWGESGCFVLATTGIVELEYAALQKSCGVFDASCRGTIEITGVDRLECMNRLTTQQISTMKVGESKQAFVTNRKGSIVADVVIHVLQESVWIDVDVTVVPQVIEHINSYIVMEDVQTKDVSDSTHWLWCLGKTAFEHEVEQGSSFCLPPSLIGIKGKAIALQTNEVVQTWSSIVEQGVRPIGWYALNMVRIENSTPVFMIDFDTSNLPHETNMIDSRVRFDKGCYLGQEIIARMESLGSPKRKLMRLKMKTDDLPVAGAQIWNDDTITGTPIGVVTSSAISPMAGGIPAVLVMLAKQQAAPGTFVYMYVGTDIIEAEVLPLELELKDATE